MITIIELLGRPPNRQLAEPDGPPDHMQRFACRDCGYERAYHENGQCRDCHQEYMERSEGDENGE